jgi:hypothetical protein
MTFIRIYSSKADAMLTLKALKAYVVGASRLCPDQLWVDYADNCLKTRISARFLPSGPQRRLMLNAKL